MWSRLVPLIVANLFLELIPSACSALSRSFRSACENLRSSKLTRHQPRHCRTLRRQELVLSKERAEQLGRERIPRREGMARAALGELHAGASAHGLREIDVFGLSFSRAEHVC